MTKQGKQIDSLRLFLIKAAVLLLIVFIMDFAIGKTLRHFYFKQKSGEQYLTTYALDSTRQDMLIFGSSRANHHYQPSIFKEHFNASYYNVGRDGSSIFYHYAVLKIVLKRYQPKIIFLDVMSQEFKPSSYVYDRLSILLPYYQNHPEIRPILAYRGKYEKIKMLSAIYPFNSGILTIAAGNAKFNVQRKGTEYGYVALHNTWKGTLQTNSYNPEYEVDSNAVDMYRQFIDDCKNAGVELFIVCSPYLNINNSNDKSIALARLIATEKGVPFFNYAADKQFIGHNDYFSDPDHLNDNGARLFTKHLLDSVQAVRR